MGRDWSGVLRQEERVTLELRALYEAYGYRKYRMGRFEEYELYLENKNFLKNPQCITFHDTDGRVLALKPDVTLSIAKNTHATATSSEKLYYLENVYRLDQPGGTYQEIGQLGLEAIGKLDTYAFYEVLALARQTLDAVSPDNWMQLSHIGLWVSLLDELGIGQPLRGEVLECVRGKRLHDLREMLSAAGTPESAAGLIERAAAVSGAPEEALAQAREICVCEGMRGALDQLAEVLSLLEAQGFAGRTSMDLSLVNDSDYYGGLLFQGYVAGVPRALMAGGYYGNLLRKFGRELDAIGFAVYLNELRQLFRGHHGQDGDVLLLYGPGDDLRALAARAEELRGQGRNVRVEPSRPEGLRCGSVLRLDGKEADAPC